MKTDFKTKQKQLKQLLGEDFDNILISLITKCKVKDEYFEIGDVETDNEHFLKDVLERVVEGCYIDGIKIPFTEYEFHMTKWLNRDNDGFIFRNSIPNWNKVENQISEVLGLKIHQFKTELVDVDDDLPF
jgi:hypothetical protein